MLGLGPQDATCTTTLQHVFCAHLPRAPFPFPRQTGLVLTCVGSLIVSLTSATCIPTGRLQAICHVHINSHRLSKLKDRCVIDCFFEKRVDPHNLFSLRTAVGKRKVERRCHESCCCDMCRAGFSLMCEIATGSDRGLGSKGVPAGRPVAQRCGSRHTSDLDNKDNNNNDAQGR